ncbi:hypothetical protein BDQ17DRAFT_1398583 [Cyathus striatus]|nr:hypothetical protein BDQ17DRAFT_1398583 [Cyathus striatus]
MAGRDPSYKIPTTLQDWIRSDLYHSSYLILQDPALDGALKNSDPNDFPDMALATAMGRFLNLLVQSIQARRVLEVGTLGGTLSMLVKVIVIVGPAAKTLATLQPEQPYDIVFIIDNVVQDGRVANPDLSDETPEGIRRLLEAVKDDSDKGYDGFLYAVRK